MVSKHYTNFRTERNDLINKIGEGKVIYSVVMLDEKRNREFKYEITDNAILIVKDKTEDYIITKMVARPSRIKKYWADAPQDIMRLAIYHTKMKMFI